MEKQNEEPEKEELGEETPKKKRGWPKGKPRKPKDKKEQSLAEKKPVKHRKRRRRRRKCQLVEAAAAENQPIGKNPETCGVRIVAFAVKVDGDTRIKLAKKDTAEIAPCEELMFKLTLEKDGIPIKSAFDEIRSFAEAFAQCSGLKVVPQ